LAVVFDDLGRGDGKRADEVARVMIDAKVERIARKVNTSLRVLAVGLGAKQVNL